MVLSEPTPLCRQGHGRLPTGLLRVDWHLDLPIFLSLCTHACTCACLLAEVDAMHVHFHFIVQVNPQQHGYCLLHCHELHRVPARMHYTCNEVGSQYHRSYWSQDAARTHEGRKGGSGGLGPFSEYHSQKKIQKHLLSMKSAFKIAEATSPQILRELMRVWKSKVEDEVCFSDDVQKKLEKLVFAACPRMLLQLIGVKGESVGGEGCRIHFSEYYCQKKIKKNRLCCVYIYLWIDRLESLRAKNTSKNLVITTEWTMRYIFVK